MSNELTCPKCGSGMRSYERNEVVVDQCTGCGGLFLDRGELEALAQAESAFYGGGQQQPQAQPTPAAPQPQQPQQPQQNFGQQPQQNFGQQPQQNYGQQDYRGQKKKKSKRSFLEDLFEG